MLNVIRPLLLVTALSVAGQALAQDPPAEPRDEPRTEQGSQREAAGNRVRQVEREGGRVLRAEPMQRGGRETYRIKVLTPEGRVRVLDEGRSRDVRSERDDRRRSRAADSRRAAPLPEADGPPRRADADDGRARDDRRN